ncbi:methanol dehydrogenase [Raphidocelis subcapitata]|uniref:Methanol dehydrogenase n=1 Tax=Raphidocelis subcapitata TaxID=307507 RepID=A0A2V0P4G9_9CHLO|nr:methanol dehydrogenase [Raphidocelis subcapitata]|eukprot:GBF92753.1 methanol dehydrogenase [Raphidocelis subcapitata]
MKASVPAARARSGLRPAAAPCSSRPRACAAAPCTTCARGAATAEGAAPAPGPLQWAARTVAAAALSAALVLSPPFAGAPPAAAGSAPPLYDGASIVASELRGPISRDLEQLERDAGWKVRVWTAYGGPGLSKPPPGASPRELWGPPDSRTLWLIVDPSSPNIINMTYIGDDVLFKLRRPFLQEVQSRYGNLFFVRDNGESAAVQQATAALTQCLAAPEGCKVVPGLPSDQYFFTLAFSITGGLIAGFVSRIKPQGPVQRQWVWLLIFSPLWAPLFVNFGLGPVVSRTSDLAPILGNTAGFLAAAALPYLDRLGAPAQQQGDGGSGKGGGSA